MRRFYILIFIFINFILYSNDFSQDNWSFKKIDGGEVYYKKDFGKIPILCFHKIGNEERYSITVENFENFLIYLNKNKFYLLSDKELIQKDFSMIPTGYKPIVLGSDDASEGNFLYKTNGDIETGKVLYSGSEPVIEENSMVYLLQKHMKRLNSKINFTFYIAFNGVPFRQTGGFSFNNNYYLNNPVIKEKFNYLLDNFIVGIHTFSHPVTKDSNPVDFKLELDTYYKIMESYVGERIIEINTLAYPYGCADLNPEMEKMITNYKYKDASISGGFDFNGYFSNSPYTGKVNKYDISRLGVDNKNIDKVYYFLENVKLYKSDRVFKVKAEANLEKYNVVSTDKVEVEL